MNWLILIPFGIVILALLLYLIRKNQKDKDKLEKHMNNNFYKRKDDGEVDQ